METEEISSPLLKAIDLAGEIKTLTLKNAPEPDTVSVPSSILPETKPIAYLMKTSCLSPSVIYPLLTWSYTCCLPKLNLVPAPIHHLTTTFRSVNCKCKSTVDLSTQYYSLSYCSTTVFLRLRRQSHSCVTVFLYVNTVLLALLLLYSCITLRRSMPSSDRPSAKAGMLLLRRLVGLRTFRETSRGTSSRYIWRRLRLMQACLCVLCCKIWLTPTTAQMQKKKCTNMSSTASWYTILHMTTLV